MATAIFAFGTKRISDFSVKIKQNTTPNKRQNAS